MKKLIATLAIAALPAVVAYATLTGDTETTNTVNGASVITKWHFELSDIDSVPRTATLLWSENVFGNVTIPNILSADNGNCTWTVTKVADHAIADHPGLLSIEVPNSILEIGAYAFSNCTALAEVTLNYGVRHIGERAFVNTAIREIGLPDSVIDIHGELNAGTLLTSKITISDSSHFVYDESGVLYNRDKTKLYACPTRAEGTVTIPASVTNIATDAFFGCHRLTYLNNPATVNTIGSGAFNVAGIWPGLSAPESTPHLSALFFKGPKPDAAEDVFLGTPEDMVVYALDKDWSETTWKGRTVLPIGDNTNPP